MATVDKASLRDEFDRLKAQFEQLSKTGNMPTESRALFSALLVLLEVLMAIFMENSTRKSTRNSSIPSSQTGKDDSATTTAGRQRKGAAQNDARPSHTRTVETTTVVSVDACAEYKKH